MEKKSVMMIDDDPEDRQFFLKAITKLNQNLECRVAESGEEALDHLRKTEQLPHFIFLDVNMPRMDGSQCLIELKRDEKLKNIPVIIYSTSNSERDKEAFLECGAVYFLNKPSNISTLQSEISRALKKADQAVSRATGKM